MSLRGKVWVRNRATSKWPVEYFCGASMGHIPFEPVWLHRAVIGAGSIAHHLAQRISTRPIALGRLEYRPCCRIQEIDYAPGHFTRSRTDRHFEIPTYTKPHSQQGIEIGFTANFCTV